MTAHGLKLQQSKIPNRHRRIIRIFISFFIRGIQVCPNGLWRVGGGTGARLLIGKVRSTWKLGLHPATAMKN